MTDKEQDELAVRIKHHGPCPKEKGHGVAATVGGVVYALCCGFFMGSMVASYIDDKNGLQAEAIKRGYAIYSPATGKWQWR